MSDIEVEQNHINDSKEFEQQGRGYDPKVLAQLNKTINLVDSFLTMISEMGSKLTTIQSDCINLRTLHKKETAGSASKKDPKKVIQSPQFEISTFTEGFLKLFGMESRQYPIETKEIELIMKSAMTNNSIMKTDLDNSYYSVFNITDTEREIHRISCETNPKLSISTNEFGSLIKRIIVKNTTINLNGKVINLKYYLNTTPIEVISNEFVKQNLASIQNNDIVLVDEVFDALNDLNKTSNRQLDNPRLSLSKFNKFLTLSKDNDDIYVEVDSSIEVPSELYVELNGKRYAKNIDYTKFLKKKTQIVKDQ